MMLADKIAQMFPSEVAALRRTFRTALDIPRPVQEVVSRNLAFLSRLVEEGLPKGQLVLLVDHWGYVGPNGTRLKRKTFYSAFERARASTELDDHSATAKASAVVAPLAHPVSSATLDKPLSQPSPKAPGCADECGLVQTDADVRGIMQTTAKRCSHLTPSAGGRSALEASDDDCGILQPSADDRALEPPSHDIAPSGDVPAATFAVDVATDGCPPGTDGCEPATALRGDQPVLAYATSTAAEASADADPPNADPPLGSNVTGGSPKRQAPLSPDNPIYRAARILIEKGE